jgi:hypothetical protein
MLIKSLIENLNFVDPHIRTAIGSKLVNCWSVMNIIYCLVYTSLPILVFQILWFKVYQMSL